MGIFDGIGKAQYFESGKYLQPGLYLVDIQRVKQAKTRMNRPFFVAEMKIVEASDVKEFPVGTDASWMVMLDHDAALGNIKHFISVASGTKLDEITEQDAEDAVSEQNPLAGIRLRVMAVNVKTRAGKDFTRVKFMSASTSAAEAAAAHAKDVAAAAAAAGAPAPAAAAV